MEPLLTELNAKFSNEARLQRVTIPSIRALAALKRGQSEEALSYLDKAEPYKDLENYYLRGLAHAKAGRSKEAAAEFQKIIDHYGLALVTVPVIYEMSHLQIARACAAMGDASNARRYYEKFLAFFKNADPDLPVINEARAELAKLPKIPS